MIRPADARAAAPVARFATFDSWGREDDELLKSPWEATRRPVEVSILDFATCWRSALRVEK